MFLLFYSTDVRWHPSESYWDSSQTSLRWVSRGSLCDFEVWIPRATFGKKTVGHIWKLIQHCLVGGFNRLENYQSIERIIPYIMENKKCSKPLTSCSPCQNTWIKWWEIVWEKREPVLDIVCDQVPGFESGEITPLSLQSADILWKATSPMVSPIIHCGNQTQQWTCSLLNLSATGKSFAHENKWGIFRCRRKEDPHV